MASKTILELQRNLTARYAELTAESVGLQTELAKASPAWGPRGRNCCGAEPAFAAVALLLWHLCCLLLLGKIASRLTSFLPRLDLLGCRCSGR